MSITDYVSGKRRRNGNGGDDMPTPPQFLELPSLLPKADELSESARRHLAGLDDMRSQIERVSAENETLRRQVYRLEAEQDVKDILIQQLQTENQALGIAIDDASRKLVRVEAVVEKLGGDVLDNNGRFAAGLSSVLDEIHATIAPPPPDDSSKHAVDQTALADALAEPPKAGTPADKPA